MNSSASGLPSLRISPESDNEVGIGDLLRVLRRHRAAMALVCAAVFALGYWIVNNLEPRYTAETTLILEVANGKPVDVESVVAGLNPDTALINSEIDVLGSRDLAKEVVDQLGLMADPEFNSVRRASRPGLLVRSGILEFLPQPLREWLREKREDFQDVGAERVRTMVVNSVMSNLWVENDGESYTISLYFEAGGPVVAAAVANAFADLYLADRMQRKYLATERAAEWVKGKLDGLRRQATAADRAVQKFREQHQIVALDEGTVLDRQLEGLSAELAAASATRARRESALAEVRKATSGDGRFTVPQIASSPLVRELRSEENLLRTQLAELRTGLGPRHARVLEMENKLQELQNRLRQAAARIMDQLRTDVRVARAQERALTAQLQGLIAKHNAADRAAIELRQLITEATAARSLFDAFVQGLSRTSAEVGASEPDARILSRAVPPLNPSFPPRVLLLLLTAIVAVLLALMAVAVLELLNRGYRNPDDLERAHGFPVLGLVPLTHLRGFGQRHPSIEVVERPSSRFTDAVQSVCAGLACTHADQTQVALVTSAVPNEGKTTFAIALGRVAARGGKRVLVIDCDLRRPSVGRDLDHVSDRGVVELAAGGARTDQVVQIDQPSGMAFVPASKSVSFPAEILSSRGLYSFVQQARSEFDLIILDSPPVGIVSDALVLSGLADSTLLMVRWGKTPRSAVAAAVKKLATAGKPVTAAVFSHVDLKRCVYYGYYPLVSSERYFADLENRSGAAGRSG